MGHEVPGMRGIDSHISDRMRKSRVSALQDLWEESLAEQVQMTPRSAVGVLDALLARA